MPLQAAGMSSLISKSIEHDTLGPKVHDMCLGFRVYIDMYTYIYIYIYVVPTLGSLHPQGLF